MHKAEWILIFMQTNKQKQNPQKKTSLLCLIEER